MQVLNVIQTYYNAIDDKKYDLDGAVEILSAEHAADPYRRLVLRADAKLNYGDVRDIFARSQQIGFPGMSLLVGERHRTADESIRGAGSTTAENSGT